MPVDEPDAGQVNFDLLPTRHVRRVEVLAGTASLLGPNSPGGALERCLTPGMPRTIELALRRRLGAE